MNKLPNDYFLDIDDEMLEYLEKNGEESIKEIDEFNDKIKENGYKLLNLLIIGIGSSFLLLAKEKGINNFSICLFIFMILWICSAIYLVLYILKVHKRAIIKTSPDFLYTSDFKVRKDDAEFYKNLQEKGFHSCKKLIDVIKRRRLIDLCNSVKDLVLLNKRMGNRLTGATIFSVAAPVVSFLIFLCLFLKSHLYVVIFY